MFSSQGLKGRVAVITGGVSGIGLGAARALLRAGVDHVYALDVQPLKETLPDKMTLIQCDVASENSVVEALTTIPGDIHILINSAGISSAARIANRKGPHPFDKFKKIIDVNLIGTFNVTRLVAARMLRQRQLPHAAATEEVRNLKNNNKERGIIINIASASAFDGEGGQTAYAASKAGVVGMTLPMARDLSRFNIRVVTIAPGLVTTPMTSEGGMSEAMLEGFAGSVLTPKRFAHVDEIGHLIVSLVGSSYVNATTIRVDGGIRLSNI